MTKKTETEVAAEVEAVLGADDATPHERITAARVRLVFARERLSTLKPSRALAVALTHMDTASLWLAEAAKEVGDRG